MNVNVIIGVGNMVMVGVMDMVVGVVGNCVVGIVMMFGIVIIGI